MDHFAEDLSATSDPWRHAPRKTIMETVIAPFRDSTHTLMTPLRPSGREGVSEAPRRVEIPVTKELSDLSRDLIAVRDRRDREAFGRLFDHFAPRLKAMLLYGGLRDGSAEDVVQDVMLAVWHKAAQFDPHRADAAGWIFGIARNRRIDLARRKPLSQPDDMPDLPSLDPDAGQVLALQQEARQLTEALARLAPEQADALRAAYFENMPHSRISEMTGLPLGTIKSRIRLGLERLRHELRSIAP